MGFFDFLKTLGDKDESLYEEEQNAYRFQLLKRVRNPATPRTRIGSACPTCTD